MLDFEYIMKVGKDRDRQESVSKAPVACYSAAFDDYSKNVGRIEIRDDADGNFSELVLCTDAGESILLGADRDQWGVFYTIDGRTVAQEDKTRSFIDALIGGLQEVRRRYERETKSAVVSSDQQLIQGVVADRQG